MKNAKSLRRQNLEKSIKKLFGNGMRATGKGYSHFSSRMIQLRGSPTTTPMVTDYEERTEFGPVKFPEELVPLLRRGDTFLATFGYRENSW